MKRIGFAGWLAAGCLAMVARGENWAQWRGPFFNGSTTETGLPESWSATSNTLWATPLPGMSAATPAVWNDTVFVASSDTNRNLLLLALDAGTGAVRWQRQVGTGDFSQGNNNLASPSPVTDGKSVFALCGTGDLAAFDFAGNPRWSRSLGRDFGKFAIMWLYGSSPLLLDGRLYVQVLQRNPPTYKYALDDRPERDSYLLCIDPETGKDLWRHVRATDAKDESMEAYTTPIPYCGANSNELILVGGDCVSGHRPLTGEELWRCYGLNPKKGSWMRIVPSAAAADGLIYACGPKREAVLAIRDGGKGDVSGTHLAWSYTNCTADVCTPLIYRGRLHILDGDKKMLACLDPKTGSEKWKGKLPVGSIVRASPTGADGRIYCISENGDVVVLKAGDEFNILATVPMGEGPCRASVVAAGGRLYIRTAQRLHCIGTK